MGEEKGSGKGSAEAFTEKEYMYLGELVAEALFYGRSFDKMSRVEQVTLFQKIDGKIEEKKV